MEIVSGENVFNDLLENTLHADTQVEAESVSLTAGAISELTGPGELDFGGSEFQLADRHGVEPIKRSDEDDYGWWSLAEGQYILEFNEQIGLESGHYALLQPHDHLYWNGVSHPTLFLDADDTDMALSVPITVGHNGVEIKENARVSSVRIIKTA
jgi:hypothetical protein